MVFTTVLGTNTYLSHQSRAVKNNEIEQCARPIADAVWVDPHEYERLFSANLAIQADLLKFDSTCHTYT
jgi:hypothetical protein